MNLYLYIYQKVFSHFVAEHINNNLSISVYVLCILKYQMDNSDSFSLFFFHFKARRNFYTVDLDIVAKVEPHITMMSGDFSQSIKLNSKKNCIKSVNVYLVVSHPYDSIFWFGINIY